MTDRIKSLTVVLEKDIREDDCEGIIDAIKMIRGVLKVDYEVADHEHHAAKVQARYELQKEMREILFK